MSRYISKIFIKTTKTTNSTATQNGYLTTCAQPPHQGYRFPTMSLKLTIECKTNSLKYYLLLKFLQFDAVKTQKKQWIKRKVKLSKRKKYI